MLEKYTNYWLSGAIQLLVEFSNRGDYRFKAKRCCAGFCKIILRTEEINVMLSLSYLNVKYNMKEIST